MRALLAFIFGCAHRRLSWPMTLNRHCSVVCLSCGRRFPYDWQAMRVSPRKEIS